VDVHPPARVTDFELKVSYQGGEIRHLGAKIVDPGGGGNRVEPECSYGNTEVDVVVEARSGDGLLNEVLDATLGVPTHYGNPGEHNMSVSLKAPLDPDNMMGTATFDDTRPPQTHMKDLEVRVYGSFGGEEGGMRGYGWSVTILYGGGGSDFRIANFRLQ